jgi:Cu-Zn family superoxide dismutase
MHKIAFMSGLVVLGVALAWHTQVAAQGTAASARATLRDTQGKTLGEATLRESSAGVLLKVDLTGVPAGTHAFHIHAVGRCDPPDFMSAGGHFNPAMMKHGLMAAGGPHAGDMPNFTVLENGTSKATVRDPRVTLGEGPNSLFANEGTALVIHAKPDDNKSQPAGNAGDRIACGVVKK